MLGELIRVAEELGIERISPERRALGGTSRNPLSHLGEAETIHAVLTVPELMTATVLTDDRFAAHFARQQGIRVINTPTLLREAWQQGRLACPRPYELLVDMRARRRWVVMPADHNGICPT